MTAANQGGVEAEASHSPQAVPSIIMPLCTRLHAPHASATLLINFKKLVSL